MPQRSGLYDEGGIPEEQTSEDGRWRPSNKPTAGQPADHALSPGARVKATFVDRTGPNSHVTGLSTKPVSGALVLLRRLVPYGAHIADEKNGRIPMTEGVCGPGDEPDFLS